MEHTTHSRAPLRDAGFAVLAAALYALNTPLSKRLLGGVSSSMLAALLYLGAGLGVSMLMLGRSMLGHAGRERPLTRADLPYTAGMVALDIAAPVLLMAGLSRTEAATAALLNNFEIVATALIALALFRERISARLWLGIGLVTAASAVLSYEGGGGQTLSPGALLVLGACACWGMENNCTRRLSDKDPLEIVVVKGWGSGAGALALAFALGERLPEPGTLCAALLLGFVAYGLSIVCYIRAQRGLGAARTSAYYAIAPFLAAGLSIAFLREQPTARFFCALALMAAGAYYATFPEGHGHRHAGVRSIDAFACTSRLAGWNPAFKTVFAVAVLLFCVAADRPAVSLLVLAAMAWLTVARGGLHFRDYLGLLAIPLAFLAVSGLTLALDLSWTARPGLCWSLHWFYVYTTPAQLYRAVSISLKALGAVSAMYFLTLTTPACEIVGVLRRARLPRLFIELMYLIYRFVFILLDMQQRMRASAESRLGYRDFPTACRSFGGTAGNLLIVALRRASTYYDAMTARCYDGDLRFLEEEKPVRPAQVGWACAFGALLLAARLFG